jgi:serine/threonine-protein kinase RsbW
MRQDEDSRLAESQADKISYTLESSLDSVDRIEKTAEEMAKKAGLDEDEIYRVTMAVGAPRKCLRFDQAGGRIV